jgi:hypothetical protein
MRVPSCSRHGFIFWPLDNITSAPALGPWQGLLVFADNQLGPPYFLLRFEESRAGRYAGRTTTSSELSQPGMNSGAREHAGILRCADDGPRRTTGSNPVDARRD